MPQTYYPESMPTPLQFARGLMWLQVALNAVAMLILLAAVSAREPGADPEALTPVLVLGVLTALLIAGLAVRLTSQRRWVRVCTIVVECLVSVDGAVKFLTTHTILALLVLAVSTAVIVLLAGSGASRWFTV